MSTRRFDIWFLRTARPNSGIMHEPLQANGDANTMLHLYTWPTPNGHKVHIMLEELGVEYTVIPVDIWAGEQFAADFLRISPNNKMPALVDNDGPDGAPLSIFESGTILLYLAEKHRRFLPVDLRGRWDVVQWLMFQMSGVGPFLGQAHHFRGYATEKIEYAIDRYTNEASRIYQVLDRRLADREYLAGDYSIADIATFPWAAPARAPGTGARGLPARGAMVPCHRAPPRGGARRTGARGPASCRPAERRSAGEHVRGQTVREAVEMPIQRPSHEPVQAPIHRMSARARRTGPAIAG